jgi:hypothetical protein
MRRTSAIRGADSLLRATVRSLAAPAIAAAALLLGAAHASTEVISGDGNANGLICGPTPGPDRRT